MAEQSVIDAVDANGFAILDDVIDGATVARCRAALTRAAEHSEEIGVSTRMEALDPGGRNVRVYDLIEHDEAFVELIGHEVIVDYCRALLAEDFVISNFTANTALPGSQSMNPHCDQSTVMPEPWTERLCFNAIWCLHDVDEENGATRYLPGSHHFGRFDEVPDNPEENMLSFEAKAGSVILMDGRLWHTSGANTSSDRHRAMLFAFYARSFIRLQNNWWRTLSRETRSTLSPQMKNWLGLDMGNIEYGTYLAEH
ncbi:MAG: phytanoyl-CoA dioxygenase family protein [Acidobacteria bacterium]|nr:phytanoyl-CoA dioxygenase family protein [Acidobacteriota bacterium]